MMGRKKFIHKNCCGYGLIVQRRFNTIIKKSSAVWICRIEQEIEGTLPGTFKQRIVCCFLLVLVKRFLPSTHWPSLLIDHSSHNITATSVKPQASGLPQHHKWHPPYSHAVRSTASLGIPQQSATVINNLKAYEKHCKEQSQVFLFEAGEGNQR